MSTPAVKRILQPVHPNLGLELAYRRKLEAMVDEMNRSLLSQLKAAYNVNTPEMANDASPAVALRQIMRSLARRWQKRFDEAAPELAKYFAEAAWKRSDKALASILKKAGFSVKFKLTKTINDILQASIGEQVGLIRSIAQENLMQVEGLVLRSVQQGRDLHTLTKEIQARFGLTRRRASLIARDQNNKATATITRARQQEVGITEAVWLHSHGGKTPRPTHVAQNGRVYKVADGWFDPDERKWIWPGTLINCRCVARPIIPGLGRPAVALDEAPPRNPTHDYKWWDGAVWVEGTLAQDKGTFIESQHPRDADGKFAKVSNGVTHPKAGTTTGSVWEIANALSNQHNAHATKKQVLAATATTLNPATVATQYSLWKKFHGVGKPAAPKIEKPAVAPQKTHPAKKESEDFAAKMGYESAAEHAETMAELANFTETSNYQGLTFFTSPASGNMLSWNDETGHWSYATPSGFVVKEGDGTAALADYLNDKLDAGISTSVKSGPSSTLTMSGLLDDFDFAPAEGVENGWAAPDFTNLSADPKTGKWTHYDVDDNVLASGTGPEELSKHLEDYLDPGEFEDDTENEESGVPSVNVPVAPVTQQAPKKLSDFNHVGSKPGGSNPGAMYASPDGTLWLVKGSNSGDATPRSKNEILASKLMLLTGTGAPEMIPVELEGKHGGGIGVGSKIISDFDVFNPSNKEQLKAVQSDFAVQAWLANHDALGMNLDNTVIKDGKAYNIDPGGALLYRAQGEAKGASFGDTVTELQSMRDPSKSPKGAKVYGAMTNAEIVESAKKVAAVDDASVKALCVKHGPFSTDAENLKLADKLIARKADLLKQVAAMQPQAKSEPVVTAPTPQPAPAPAPAHPDKEPDLEAELKGLGYPKSSKHGDVTYFKDGQGGQVSFHDTEKTWQHKVNGVLVSSGKGPIDLVDHVFGHSLSPKQAPKPSTTASAASPPDIPTPNTSAEYKGAVKTLSAKHGFKYKIGNDTYNYFVKPDGSKISINHKEGSWKLELPSGTKYKGKSLNDLQGKLAGTSSTVSLQGQTKTAHTSAPSPSLGTAKLESNPSFSTHGVPLPHALPSAIQTSLKKYTGSHYSSMNSALRNGTVASSSHQKDILNMQKAFALLPGVKTEVKVGRKISFEALQTMVQKAGLSGGVNAISPGHILHDDGFMSTSHSDAWSGAVKFHITLPVGAKAIYVKPISNHPGEDETVLASGTRLKVTKVDKTPYKEYKNGVWTVVPDKFNFALHVTAVV